MENLYGLLDGGFVMEVSVSSRKEAK